MLCSHLAPRDEKMSHAKARSRKARKNDNTEKRQIDRRAGDQPTGRCPPPGFTPRLTTSTSMVSQPQEPIMHAIRTLTLATLSAPIRVVRRLVVTRFALRLSLSCRPPILRLRMVWPFYPASLLISEI